MNLSIYLDARRTSQWGLSCEKFSGEGMGTPFLEHIHLAGSQIFIAISDLVSSDHIGDFQVVCLSPQLFATRIE